jgi:hypothetical protein
MLDTRETGKRDFSCEDDESEITANDADEQIAFSPVVQKKKKRKYAGRKSSQGKAPKKKFQSRPTMITMLSHQRLPEWL